MVNKKYKFINNLYHKIFNWLLWINEWIKEEQNIHINELQVHSIE
jgi:hypothetical protein